jgi:isoquinoline 1-oxidoreductase beta subunit
VTEAVHVAKAAGAPVKTVWTREDDLRGGYYRPMSLHRARVGLGADGMPVAWHHRIVCQSIIEGTPFAAVMIKDGIDGTSVEGVADSAYVTGMAHHHVELHSPKLPVPVLWWRSVGHSHSGFAMESLVDELAYAAKIDPVEYRRRLLAKHPRHLATLNLAVAKAGIGAVGKGQGWGVAVHESFGSVVAHVALVRVTGGRIKVERVVVGVDCGVCVNPMSVAAQMEGGVGFGLSAVLHGDLHIENGRVRESNFHDHPMLRLHEMPKVETHIVPSDAPPGGIGEPGVPPIAAALGNAVFMATGQRLRQLPLRLPS